MRSLKAACIFIFFAFPALASTPQFSNRQDINTNFQHLTGLAVADFNGDGKPDIAVTDDVAKQVVVYLNNGNGTFSAPISTTLQIGALGAGAIVAGDFNEDGKQDLIVGTIAGSQGDVFLAGNGDGTFTQGQTLPGSFGFFSAAAVDLNHDSHLDLIGGGNGTLYVHLGDGHGGFVLQSFTNQGAGDTFVGVVAGDFNNDTKIDFLAAAFNANNLRYFSGNGDGSFAAPSIVSSSHISSPQSLVSADFSGDQKRDLLVGSSSIATVIFGNGDNTFQTGPSQLHFLATPPPIIPNAQTNLPIVGAADMNGDGKTDAIVADNASASINVFLNDGTGTFPQSAPDFTAGLPVGSNQLQLADLNGDGLPDIVVTNYMTQNISVFLSIRPQPTAPTVTLTGSASQTLVGASITLTAQVHGAQNLVPTGSLTLLDGTTSLGQQILDAKGQGIFTVTTLAAGQHTLSANYSGDTNYSASTASVVQSVTDFQIAATTPSQTIAAGGTASYTLTVTPVAGFAGSLTLTCSQLPALTSCDSLTVPVNGQPATATLNVHTTAPVQSNHTSVVKAAGLGFFSIFLVALFPSRRRIYSRLAVGIIAIILTGFSVGCSGSSSKSTGTVTPGTPSGPTSFTITSTITQGGQTLAHTTAATLVVQ